MDRFNIKKLANSSEINDTYWLQSLAMSDRLIEAVKIDSDDMLIALIRNPDVYKGRA